MPGYKQALDKEMLKASKKCKWRLTVSNGFRADGKQNRGTKTIGPCSAAQAEKELQIFYLEFCKKAPDPSYKLTFAEFVDIWRERHVKNLSPNSQKSGGHMFVDTRVTPYFGAMRLNKITSEHVADFFVDLKIHNERLDGRPGVLSPGSIFDIFKTLRSMLNKAVEWGYIPTNPCNAVSRDKRPKKNFRTKPILDEDDLATFLQKLFELKETATNVKYQLFFYLSLIDGCRSGEHVALTWDDVNLSSKKITISKDVYEKGGHTYIKHATKTESIREVYCDDLCVELFGKYKVFQEAFLKKKGYTNPNNYIFMKRMRAGDGREVVEPAGRSAFYHWLRAFLKRNGLPHVDVHGFRRMAASYCVNNQVPLTTIRQMLGHKSLSTTMIYLRSLELNRQAGTQVLSDAYQKLLKSKRSEVDDSQPK